MNVGASKPTAQTGRPRVILANAQVRAPSASLCAFTPCFHW